MTETEVIVGCLVIALFDCALELEVASGSFLDAPKEVQSVAPTCGIELGLEVFKLLEDDLFLLCSQVVEGDSEASWSLSEKV